MRTQISIPGRDIVSSGSLVMDQGQAGFRLSIEDIVLDFEFVPGPGEPRADVSQPTPKWARFTLHGFDNPLGTSYALTDAVAVAGRPLSAAFFVHAMEGEPMRRVVSYTLSAAAGAGGD